MMKKWTSYYGMICQVEVSEDLKGYSFRGAGVFFAEPMEGDLRKYDLYDSLEELLDALRVQYEQENRDCKVVVKHLKALIIQNEKDAMNYENKIQFLTSLMTDPEKRNQTRKNGCIGWPTN